MPSYSYSKPGAAEAAACEYSQYPWFPQKQTVSSSGGSSPGELPADSILLLGASPKIHRTVPHDQGRCDGGLRAKRYKFPAVIVNHFQISACQLLRNSTLCRLRAH